jgi:hypothetical protein
MYDTIFICFIILVESCIILLSIFLLISVRFFIIFLNFIYSIFMFMYFFNNDRKMNLSYDYFKYIKKLFFIFFIFLFFSLFYSLLNFSPVYKTMFFFFIFFSLMFINYFKQNTYLKITNFLSLCINFRNMLQCYGDKLINQLNEYICDSEYMRHDLNSIYYLYYFYRECKFYFTTLFTSNKFVLKVKNKLKTNNNQKRHYMFKSKSPKYILEKTNKVIDLLSNNTNNTNNTNNSNNSNININVNSDNFHFPKYTSGSYENYKKFLSISIEKYGTKLSDINFNTFNECEKIKKLHSFFLISNKKLTFKGQCQESDNDIDFEISINGNENTILFYYNAQLVKLYCDFNKGIIEKVDIRNAMISFKNDILVSKFNDPN